MAPTGADWKPPRGRNRWSALPNSACGPTTPRRDGTDTHGPNGKDTGTLRTRLCTNEDMVPIGPARRRQEFVSPGPSYQPVLTLAAGIRVDSLAARLLAVATPTRLPTARPSLYPQTLRLGYDRTLKVRNFRSTNVGNFQSQLTLHADRTSGATPTVLGSCDFTH